MWKHGSLDDDICTWLTMGWLADHLRGILVISIDVHGTIRGQPKIEKNGAALATTSKQENKRERVGIFVNNRLGGNEGDGLLLRELVGRSLQRVFRCGVYRCFHEEREDGLHKYISPF